MIHQDLIDSGTSETRRLFGFSSDDQSSMFCQFALFRFLGGRTALASVFSTEVLAVIDQMLGVDYQFNFNSSRPGLARKLPGSVQGVTYSFARRPYVYLADPVWTWTFPRLDREPLAEFGAWCARGCPVVVDGRLVTTRSHQGATGSTDMICRVDSL